LTGAGGQQFFNDRTSLFLKNPVITGSSATFAGKIQFNYDPTAGNVFTVKTTPSSNLALWRWVIGYPIDGSSVGIVTPVNQHYTVTPDFTANYEFQAWQSWCSNNARVVNAGVYFILGIY